MRLCQGIHVIFLPSHAHAFPRTPTFTRHVRDLRAVFARQDDPITLATIRTTYRLDAHAHIDAHHQEHLLGLDEALGQRIVMYSLQLVRDAVASHAAAADRPPPSPTAATHSANTTTVGATTRS